MKIIDFTEIQLKKYIEKIRPPKEIRDEIDVSYSFKNKIVEIYEIRPKWDDKNILQNFPIARAKFIKSKNIWRVYWMASNEKWIKYEPRPEVNNFSEFINILENDKNGCFWG